MDGAASVDTEKKGDSGQEGGGHAAPMASPSQAVAAKAEEAPVTASTATPACEPSAPPATTVTAPVESTRAAAAAATVTAVEGEHADPNATLPPTTTAADGGEAETEKKVWKPMLISRKADFSVAEMMRQLRDGEVERLVQPKLKSTLVVKKAKQPLGAGQETATPLPPPTSMPAPQKDKHTDASRLANARKAAAVVVVTTEETPQPAGRPALVKSSATFAEKLKGKQQQHQREATERAAAAKEEDEHVADGTRTPPRAAQKPLKSSTASSAKASPVKQGSVKKRAKKSAAVGRETEAAAADASTGPAPQVTTVKAKMSLAELRALRHRGTVVATAGAGAASSNGTGDLSQQQQNPHLAKSTMTGPTSGAAATVKDGEARVVDEISSLLLQYCMGDPSGPAAATAHAAAAAAAAETGASKKALDPKSWPTLHSSDDSEGKAEKAKATAAAVSDEEKKEQDAPDGTATAAAANPEVQLYNRLTDLCQDEHVTSSTLDLIHELLKHTRVIPLRPQPLADEGSDSAADAQAEDTTHRRLYAQQIILVLINQMKQKKLMEEQRRQLLGLQKQQRGGTTTLSALSAPFVPASVAAQQQYLQASTGRVHAPGTHLTTFAPQSTTTTTSAAVPSSAGRIPSLATGTVPTASDADGASPPSRPAAANADADMKQLLDVLRDRLVQSATAPAVSISEDERRVLKEIQQSFKQQQQQQRNTIGPTPHSASPASVVSSSQAGGSSLVFNASQATSVSPQTAGESAAPPATTGASANRTVFTYKTLLYDPSSSSTEDVAGMAHHPTQSTRAAAAKPTSRGISGDAAPFVPRSAVAPAAAPAGLNAAAPAFVPPSAAATATTAPTVATGPAPSSRPAATRHAPLTAASKPASTAPAAAPTQPWASPEMFAQWKKSMEDYYRSLTYAEFAAAMQQQQQQ